MQAPEIIEVDPDDDDIYCDGGEYYGHPRVYLTLGDDGEAECYYCSRRFVAKKAPPVAQSSTG